MATLLLEESITAESIWRNIASSQQPLFADMPIERVEPDPNNKRHWMAATDDQKIMLHVYKPDYVLKQFKKVVVPIFNNAYGFNVDKSKKKELAQQLVKDTFTYLLFHELFHPVYCPKSKTDKEKFDLALKDGIKRAEPHLSSRDLINKTGNVRNAIWDLLIDTFFTHYSTNGSDYDQGLRTEISKLGNKFDQNLIETLPDGIVTTWDVVELADHKPETLFYPLTRSMYSLLHCDNPDLRSEVFDYFRNKIDRKISDYDLETAIVGSLSGSVKYLNKHELALVGVDKNRMVDSSQELYQARDNQQGSVARKYVVEAITKINTSTELRYRSVEGIIEPLAKYISTQKEEKRDGANSDGNQSDGDDQTSTSEEGGGAEDTLQSLINQNDPDVDGMLTSIANDQSAPNNNRNKRLSNLAKDEYYKRNSRALPIKSPTLESETVVVGTIKVPVKVSERLLTPDQLHDLPMDQIIQFQQDTGLICLSRLSQHQWKYEIYEWHEQQIQDYQHKKTGIILPDNIIFRVDGSGSMTSTESFIGSKDRYDCLMHVIYGIAKSTAQAAKEMQKEVQVVAVSYSEPGKTIVSESVELQHFYDTPNNSAKQVLLNPQKSYTYHDLSAYQEAHAKCNPGKTIEIIVTDGDLNTDHDQSMTEIKKILDQENNLMVYFSIFQEGSFARRMGRLATIKSNLTYKPFLSFDGLQSVANDIIVQYKECRR